MALNPNSTRNDVLVRSMRRQQYLLRAVPPLAPSADLGNIAGGGSPVKVGQHVRMGKKAKGG